ncbi:MAG: hypothetical protein OEZ06_05445 [Myxococcales bacterium]|nr:hypothetical protein [Myxococcales bacterium]
MRPLAITGVGLVSPLGVGYGALCQAIADHGRIGSSAFRSRCTVFDPEKIEAPLAAEAWDFDATEYLGKKGLRNFDRLTRFLLVSAKHALEHAGLKLDGEHRVYGGERVGVCSATAYGSLDSITELVEVAELEDPRFLNPNRFPNTVINTAAGYVSIREDLRAPNVTVVDGNCGALDAVLNAETHLHNDRADAFLVGGGEVLSDPLYLAFRKLGALAEEPERYAPGSAEGYGMRLGEGAAYLCVEHDGRATERGARVLGRVVGYGNAFEPPQSEAALVHASPLALERAIAMALDDAGLGPDDLDLVCASMNGLGPFDRAELEALDRSVGPELPVVLPKALIGETFGAGGALGAMWALAAFEGLPVGPLLRGTIAGRPERALVVAVGFYGNASALVLSR